MQHSFNKYGANSFKYEILEKDINKENLFIKELRWILLLKPEYNIMLIPGEYKKYVNVNKIPKRSKLEDNDVIEIILLLNDGFNITEVAEECGVLSSTVEDIKLGRVYKHLSYLLDLPERESADNLMEHLIYRIAYSISIRHNDKRIAKVYNVPIITVKEIRKRYKNGEIIIPKTYILKD